MSHETTLRSLESIQQRKNSERIMMPVVELCQRRFQRTREEAPVKLSIINHKNEKVCSAWGTLTNYSPEGAKVRNLKYKDPQWKRLLNSQQNLKIHFTILSGKLEGLEAFGSIVRALSAGTSFGLRFDSFSIRIAG